MKILIFLVLMTGIGTDSTKTTEKKETSSLYTIKDYFIKTEDGNTYTLKAGTPVIVEVPQTYTSKNLTEGQTVSIRTKFNVVVAKQNLIAAGSMGNAVVSDITKPGIFGRAGKLELQVQSIQAVDGQQVLLSGIPINVEGQNKKGLAWGVSIPLFIFTIIGGAFGFFIKGKHAEIRPGTTANTTVASDMQIEVESVEKN